MVIDDAHDSTVDGHNGLSAAPVPHYRAEVDLFTRSWTALPRNRPWTRSATGTRLSRRPATTRSTRWEALLVGTGRRAPTGAERSALGELAARLPLALG
jgi:hypothetical protein